MATFTSAEIQKQFEGVLPSVSTCTSDISNMANICAEIAAIVESGDSGLSGSWKTLSANLESLAHGVNRCCNKLKENVDAYVKATQAAENSAALDLTATQGTANDLKDVFDSLGN